MGGERSHVVLFGPSTYMSDEGLIQDAVIDPEALVAGIVSGSGQRKIEAPKPARGLTVIETDFGPEPLEVAVNTSVAWELTLRHAEQAIETGPEAQVLGTPALELNLEIAKALAGEQAHEGYTWLADELAKAGLLEDRTELQIYLKPVIDMLEEQLSTSPNAVRLEENGFPPHLRTAIAELRLWNQRYLTVVFEAETTKLAHEKGDTRWLRADLFRDFCDPHYLLFMLSNLDWSRLNPDSAFSCGLTRQVILKLLHEAQYLHAQGAYGESDFPAIKLQ